MNFFAELKRRSVYKVAVAYVVVAWLLIQAGSILFGPLRCPRGLCFVVISLMLGFPIALAAIAWAFEMTPDGMKRTENVSPNDVIPQRSAGSPPSFCVTIALLAAGLFLFQMLRSSSTAPARLAASTALEPSTAADLFRTKAAIRATMFWDGLSEEFIRCPRSDR